MIFDVDGTLIDSIAHSYAGVCEVFRHCTIIPPSFADYCEHFEPPFEQFYRERGITESIASRHQISAWYRSTARHDRALIYPDVPNSLSALTRMEHTCALAVVSAQKNSILALQLEKVSHYFDFIVGEQQDKTPEIERICSVYRISKKFVWYVGDFAADMRSARRARVRAVGITRGRDTRHILERAGAHHVINNLDELLSIMRCH